MQEALLQKLRTLQASEPAAVFRWRHIDRKLEGYVGLSNLRLELVLFGNGLVKYVQAAPIMSLRESLPTVVLQAENLLTVSKGPRKNIVIQANKLREDEEGHQTVHTGIVTLDSNTQDTLALKVFDTIASPAFPVSKIVMPNLFRVTNKPDSITPNYTAELKSLIHAEREDSVDVLKQKFLERLSKFSSRTTSGYVIPFDYVFAGGMIVVEGTNVTKTGKQATYTISYEPFMQQCESNNWKLGNLEAQ